jgi:hypothetical protein
MDKNTAGLVGVIAGLAAMGTAQAATQSGPPNEQAMQVSSYAELLKPIANAAEVLKASNAALLQKAQARVQEVQYYNQGPPPPGYGYNNGHHHHHHHHHAYYPPPPPPPDYHHHHHHHNGVTIVVPGLGVVRGGG